MATKHTQDKTAKAVSRRHFVRNSSLAGAGTVLGLAAINSKTSLGQTPSAPHADGGHRAALIIGSGFGGAITALRLTQHKVPTLMLEKGRRWPVKADGSTFSPYIYPDGRSSWLSDVTTVPLGPPLPIDRYVGVLEARQLGGFTIMSGAAYGGGSISYGGLHVKPKKEVFEKVFPAAVSYDELQPYYQRFADKVGISPCPPDVFASEFYTHCRVVEEQTKHSGLTTEYINSATDWEIVRAEIAGTVKPSAIHGEAIYGMNSGAKKSLDTNYLREAEASGLLEVKTLHQVTDVSIEPNGVYAVYAEIIDEVGTVTSRVKYTADALFLAAGTLGSNSLLVKAKAKKLLPKLNNEVGQGFGNNGNVYVLRTDLNTPTGQWQGGPPAIGIDDHDNPITPLFIEHPQFPLGFDIRSLMYFGVGVTPTRGFFYYDEVLDRVELSWPKDDAGQAKVNEAMLTTMRRINADNGGVIDPLIFGKDYKDDSIYHPLGGLVLGKACDFYGRVKGYEKLYVMDGSVIPGSTACANPSFTIAAVVERNIEKVIAEDF